jgi:transcription-repair coupling factor (superfamily II helicase)
MEKPVPMDRLLCGDVGYGKTEVMMRAVFKCADGGRQAIILVPTTILCYQHFRTFTERFSGYPFRIASLSRFSTEQEIKEALAGLADGTVDIAIGTHRLLSKDVKFKEPGLLVVDEEQRFGVKQKEKIKTLKKNIDVLSLSATPIPRTLNMSLTGVRDMDLIALPPAGRYPVQTYVSEEQAYILKETLTREIDRGGQADCVCPRIGMIERITKDIADAVPGIRIASAHGRMSEHTLEDIMIAFTNGEYDVLVSTSIIESGIDIPNVNTMLVFESDRFGLSQLYQLRGRVGRAHRIAFCYLLYRKDAAIGEGAEKRLRAIREFTEFGSGFKVALRDLELRGAGNLLGAEQHGNIAAVGYEMYCRMVEDAVNALKRGGAGAAGGGAEDEELSPVGIDVFIPSDYIPDEASRLDYYRRLAHVRTSGDAEELAAEMADLFGEMPQSIKEFLGNHDIL